MVAVFDRIEIRSTIFRVTFFYSLVRKQDRSRPGMPGLIIPDGGHRFLLSSPSVRVSLSVPATNDRGPLYMDQVLAVIHQGNPHRLPFSLELGRDGDLLRLPVRFPPALGSVIEGQRF